MTDEALSGPLTHSEMKTFRTCRRKWYFEYYLRYGVRHADREVTGVAQLGTKIHMALEGHYTGLDALDVLATLYDAVQDERPMEHKEIAAERSYAFTMVKGYLEWVEISGVDAEYRVIGTEVDTSVSLLLLDGRTVMLRGKLDQVVERRDGTRMRLVRDYKTVGSLAKANDLIRDTQMRTYDLLHYLSTSKDDPEPDGVLYTMLLRSKRTSRATPPFYDVAHMRYNAADRRSAYSAITGTVTDMIDVRADLDAGAPHQAVAYANPTDACNWACPFKTVCPMADDGSRLGDALEAGFVKSDPWDHYGTGPMDEVRKALGSPDRGKLVNQESGGDKEG
jgi:hypothetical protein